MILTATVFIICIKRIITPNLFLHTRRKSVQFFCLWELSSAETVPMHCHGWLQTSEPVCIRHGGKTAHWYTASWIINTFQTQCIYTLCRQKHHKIRQWWHSTVYLPVWVGEASPRAVHLSPSPEHEWQTHELVHLESHSPAASEQSVITY